MSSPAERYAAARRRSARPALADFTAGYPFDLDPFQTEACEALEDGLGVLVCAPTGAGKTVVGEFAVHLALTEGSKCFYTTPIKALSNQKYNDLVDRHGSANVGLLTGDNAVNGGGAAGAVPAAGGHRHESTYSTGSTGRACCRPSPSSSAGRAATRPCDSAWTPA